MKITVKYVLSGHDVFLVANEMIWCGQNLNKTTIKKQLQSVLYSGGTQKIYDIEEENNSIEDPEKALGLCRLFFPELDFSESEKFVEQWNEKRSI